MTLSKSSHTTLKIDILTFPNAFLQHKVKGLLKACEFQILSYRLTTTCCMTLNWHITNAIPSGLLHISMSAFKELIAP